MASLVRTRRVPLILGVVLAVTLGSLPTALAATADPSLKLIILDDLVVVSAKHFEATTALAISASVEGGSGKTTIQTKENGSALVAFSLPESFVGSVAVAAIAGGDKAQASILVQDSTDDTAPTTTIITTTTLTPSTTTTAAPTSTTTTTTSTVNSTTTTLAPSASPLPGTIKLLPIGDSITEAGNSGGWRANLAPKLNGIEGTKWDFVGSQRDTVATSVDKEHEGHSGWRNDQLAAEAEAWVKATSPDVVLIHGGTNDMWQGRTAERAAADMKALITNVYKGNPDAHVEVAGIIPMFIDKDIPIAQYQALTKGLVAEFKAQGKSIAYVDMSSLLTNSDLPDGVHPNGSGNTKMANAWFNALETYVKSRS